MLRIEVDGTTVTWKADGVVKMTKSLSHALPLNVFATIHDVVSSTSCSTQLAAVSLKNLGDIPSVPKAKTKSLILALSS